MQDDDKTILMCLEDENDTYTQVLNAPEPSVEENNFNQHINVPLHTKAELSQQTYASDEIPFMYAKQNQPFLKALRALYYEIHLVERGDSKMNGTRLRERIIHLMDQHMKSLATLGYENTHIMIIRYILSTFMDELLGSVRWEGSSDWLNQHSILGHYYQETYGGEKFFQLLNQFTQEPSKYMQHMKLIYVCLSLGYLGKFARSKEGASQAERVRQELYAHIKNYDTQEEKFYKDHPASTQTHKLTFDISYRIFILGGIAILAIIYLTFTSMVKDNEDGLIELLNHAPVKKIEMKANENKENALNGEDSNG